MPLDLPLDQEDSLGFHFDRADLALKPIFASDEYSPSATLFTPTAVGDIEGGTGAIL
ncbi:hypothetical protein TUM17383_29340 [Shewanella algae]|nr:hypothetical protein TUM17383_29340 [Shewanella algae]